LGRNLFRENMRLPFVAILAVLLSGCAFSSGKQDSSHQNGASPLTVAWNGAYNSRDPARIVAMYDSDAVLWGTTAKVIAANPSAIAEYFKDAGKRPNARVTFAEQHVRSYGDIAVSSGYYTFSDVREGKNISRPARFTMVFRNRSGDWLIVAHHSSEMP
jgi:uncharacterized protein (TIGR02246 family)